MVHNQHLHTSQSQPTQPAVCSPRELDEPISAAATAEVRMANSWQHVHLVSSSTCSGWLCLALRPSCMPIQINQHMQSERLQQLRRLAGRFPPELSELHSAAVSTDAPHSLNATLGPPRLRGLCVRHHHQDGSQTHAARFAVDYVV